ncbi:MAG: prolipoprotein diacylglyceryl transferase [Pseudomonadota bacterium]
MIAFPHIHPVAFSLGPFAVHWYGISYLVSVLLGWRLANKRRNQVEGLTSNLLRELVYAVALGAVLGGKCGHFLFYSPHHWQDPLALFRLWEPGMSFHGGLIGVLLGIIWFCRRFSFRFWTIVDFVAPIVPIGLGLVRLANFINAELWGSVTTLPWGIVFPGAGPLPRHPSQLYEAFGEGLVLYVFLAVVVRQLQRTAAVHQTAVKEGLVSGFFAIGYAVIRFTLEFVRMPDPQLGYLAFGWLTMGQLLCLPLLCAGVYLVSIRGRY